MNTKGRSILAASSDLSASFLHGVSFVCDGITAGANGLVPLLDRASPIIPAGHGALKDVAAPDTSVHRYFDAL